MDIWSVWGGVCARAHLFRLRTLVHMFFCKRMLLFLLGKHVGQEWLGCTILQPHRRGRRSSSCSNSSSTSLAVLGHPWWYLTVDLMCLLQITSDADQVSSQKLICDLHTFSAEVSNSSLLSDFNWTEFLGYSGYKFIGRYMTCKYFLSFNSP